MPKRPDQHQQDREIEDFFLTTRLRWGRIEPYRFDPSLLMPFAPRWLGRKQPFGGQDNLREKPRFVCNVGWNQELWEYFPMPIEGNFVFNMAHHWDWYVAQPASGFQRGSHQLAKDQPTWRRPSPRLEPNPASGHTASELGEASFSCVLEPAGSYFPAHFYRGSEYGMMLSQGNIVRIAAALHSRCREQPREVVIAACCHFIYAHLAAHAWIEDICALLDFRLGCDNAIRQRPYPVARRRHGPLLVMEEAFCHGAALAMVQELLDPVPPEIIESRRIPPFDGKRILLTLTQWLSNHAGGPGCRPIQVSSLRHESFAEQVVTLLDKLYRYDRLEAESTIYQFFGIGLGMDDDETDQNPSPAWTTVDAYPVRADCAFHDDLGANASA